MSLSRILRLRKLTWYDVWQGAERAGRVFGVSFVALYPFGRLEDVLFGTEAFDQDLAKKATIAATIAAGSFLLRTFLPNWFRSRPALTATNEVAAHPHGADVATDA